jgi:predicted Rossmann-fold nucleotide-binding protein
LEIGKKRGIIEILCPNGNIGIMKYWNDGFWRVGILLHGVNHGVKAGEKGGEN